MRHGKKFNHLKRKKGHRKATLKSLSTALLKHKRISTTLAKAKALRTFIEPIITKSKTNTTHSRRVVFSKLMDKAIVQELFDEIGPKVADRPGGYVRVIRTGARKSDAAEMAIIELVDYNTDYASSSSSQGKKKTRRRGKSSGSSNAAATTTAKSEEE